MAVDLWQEEEIQVQRGDVYALGRHRIACIDSIDEPSVQKLLEGKVPDMVFADPPYGMKAVSSNGTIGGANPLGSKNNLRIAPNLTPNVYAPVIGDSSIHTAVASYGFCSQFYPTAIQIWWGANYYANVLPPSSCWIVWDKESTGNFADAELAWCNKKSAVRIFRHKWNGLFKASEQNQRRVHPCQKPTKLAEWCFQRFGKDGDLIYDPFLGSGITLLAAENIGNRTVYGCELSPDYIAVCIQRWQQHTGQQARLLTEKG